MKKIRFFSLLYFTVLFFSILTMLPAKGKNLDQWESSLPQAIEKAKKSKKPLFIHFYTPWCPYCVKMQNETFNDTKVKKHMASYIKIMVNVGQDYYAGQQYQVQGVPDNRLYTAERMTMVMRIPGFLPPDSFIQELIKTNEYLKKNQKLLKEYSQETRSIERKAIASSIALEYYKIEDYEQAVEYFKKSLLNDSVNIKDPYAHKKFGFSLMTLGLYKEAIQEYQKFIELIQKVNPDELWKAKFLVAFS